MLTFKTIEALEAFLTSIGLNVVGRDFVENDSGPDVSLNVFNLWEETLGPRPNIFAEGEEFNHRTGPTWSIDSGKFVGEMEWKSTPSSEEFTLILISNPQRGRNDNI